MVWNLNTVALLVPLLFLLIGLTITVAMDPYISRKHRRVMGVIIVLSFTLIVQNIWDDYLAAGELQWFLRTTLAVCGYTLRPVFLILFLYIVRPERKYLGCWALAILNWVIQMTAYFSHLCFWINEKNHYEGGPLSRACLVISLILLLYWLYQSAWNYRAARKKNMLIPLLVVLIILVSVFLDDKVGYSEQPITYLTFGIVISSMLYYIWLHLRFVQDHEDDLKARQRMRIMLSQIQPHFLYNTLSVIQDLCHSDPARAEIATVAFSQYLRGNMDSLFSETTIPFEDEWKHTQGYLDLEQMRFEGKLEVRYDIGCTSFDLPPLSLQPIVENAVNHGVRANPDGAGIVTIATREYPDRYEITVTDTGPGFDPDNPPEKQGRTHVGVQNVRERLASLCGGTLTIMSEIGRGTTATISLPKEVSRT